MVRHRREMRAKAKSHKDNFKRRLENLVKRKELPKRKTFSSNRRPSIAGKEGATTCISHNKPQRKEEQVRC